MLKQVRQLHLYLGTLFAPSIIFFALTGSLQLFGLHEGHPGEAYQPPPWVQKLGSIHKNQTVSERRGPPPGFAGEQKRPQESDEARRPPQPEGGHRNEQPGSNKLTLALKCFFLATAVGLVSSTLLGICMAFKYSRSRALVWGLLLLGTAIPVAIIAMMREHHKAVRCGTGWERTKVGKRGRLMTKNVALKISSLAFAATALFVLSNPASAVTCDRACLLEQAKQFSANMLAHTTEKIPLAANANIRENTKAIALGDSKWIGVTKILSEGVYADPILGNVIEHVAAETAAGKTVYIGTRLKLVDRQVKEVEINFDDGPRVNIKNLVPYDPIFNTIVPPEERSTREELVRIITSYFKGLTDHSPIQADYDPRCDRYHSGNRVTHNPRNGIEEGGDVGCYESNLGPKPWGPATEVRIGLIDPERGIVIGYAILYYGNSDRRMQINEVFKILDGRLRMVDNIGLMEEGITTSGFTD